MLSSVLGKLPSLIEQGDQAEPIKRDSERTHRVPDPDETDARLVGVRAPEQCRLPASWGVCLGSAAVERIRFADTVNVLLPQDSGVSDEPHGTACSECAAAEAEEEELVARFIVLHQEAVCVADVAREPETERASANTLPSVRSDPTVIERPLLGAFAVHSCNGQRNFGDVRWELLVRKIPGAIAAHNPTLRHL